MKALVTGGAGFIGHYLIQRLLTHTDWKVDIIDKLSYASRGFDRLKAIDAFDNPRVRMFTHDLTHRISNGLKRELGNPDYIFHLAAESHVDNSVEDPLEFVRSNVLGTSEFLWWAKDTCNLKKFIYMSTDEVFGPAVDGLGPFDAFDRHNPKNPYAASKSGGEQMCVAFEHTYKMPIHIVHCMNVFGIRQHPEKFIPKAIKLMLNNEIVQVYTDEDGVTGSRYYIHAEDVARLLIDLATGDEIAFKHNIAGINNIYNDDMVEYIGEVLELDYEFKPVTFDLGKSCHDVRYDIEGTLIPFWTAEDQFWQQLKDVIKWTAAHPEWLEV